MGMVNWVKEKIKSWLELVPANSTSITVTEPYTYEESIFRNKLWYRGSASELHQFYTQSDDGVANSNFWAGKSSTGIHMRKIHTGLPATIINILVDTVLGDIIGTSINPNKEGKSDEELDELWKDIAEDNNFNELFKEAVKKALVSGDGAFKISMDSELSEYPIIEYYDADKVRYNYKRGRLIEIVFLTPYKQGSRNYMLQEIYSKTGISYILLDENGDEVELATISELSDLIDLQNPEGYAKMMAVPIVFSPSSKWKDRGESLFENKLGAFDALDEVFSQWMDELRDNRTQKYIPEPLLPVDGRTGQVLYPNSFDNRYVKVKGDLQEDAQNKIDNIQGDIKHEGLLATYMTVLDLCLQGIVSPSTLGIDVKKMDNAEAQREKEKVTLYTRNKIVRVLEKVIPQLIATTLEVYNILHQQSVEELDVSISFGEYANPSFEAQIETIGSAKNFGIMSTETAIKELYGSSWTEEEIEAEIERLKQENGIIELDEPDMTKDIEIEE